MKYTAALFMLTVPALAILGEEDLLMTMDSAFRDSPDVLSITTDDGGTVTFRNSSQTKEGLGDAYYYLIDYHPEVNFWTVEMHGYEWMEWYAVSGANGNTTTTIGPPVPSPDGSRLLCAMEDITAGFIYNGIQIWNINEDQTLTLEFEDLEVPWGPLNAEWADESTVVFQKFAYDWDTYEEYTTPGKLKLDEQGIWRPLFPEDWE